VISPESNPGRLAQASLRRFFAIALGVFLLWAWGSGAQDPTHASLAGEVKHVDTGDPLPLANVFFAQTVLGTSTDMSGRFRLDRIPPGHYLLVISLVGFQPLHEEIVLRGGVRETRTLLLRPRELVAEEIQVEGQSPAEWEHSLAQFIPAFLGLTANAGECAILNPHVINFRRDSISSQLIAWTDSTIVVENRALGYRLSVVLESFSLNIGMDVGRYSIFPRFEPLSPRTDDEANTWIRNQMRTHKGSLKHFLSSLAHETLADSMFAVYSGPLDYLRGGNGLMVGGEEILLMPGLGPETLRMSFAGWLRIEYRNVIPPARSYIQMEAPSATIDYRGNLLSPFALLVGGEWAKSGVADLLPIEMH
jgi:hypothetical protein